MSDNELEIVAVEEEEIKLPELVLEKMPEQSNLVEFLKATAAMTGVLFVFSITGLYLAK